MALFEKDLSRCLQREVTRGIYTHKQARATFQRLVRKKKRLYLGKFEDHLYRLFIGQESKRPWKMFNERQPTTQVTSPQVWHEYAKVLYDIPQRDTVTKSPQCRRFEKQEKDNSS